MAAHTQKVVMVDALVGNDYSFNLCNSLKTAGVDINLVVTEDRDVTKPVGFSLLKLQPSKERGGGGKAEKTVKFFKYLSQLRRFVSENKVKVVHYQFFRRARVESLFYAFMRFTGVGMVHTVHDAMPLDEKRIDYLFRLLTYKVSKALIVHSDYIKQVLMREFDIPDEKIKIIPHGDFDDFLPENPITKAEARKSIGFSQDDQVLLFFGHIKKYKGLDLLLQAFEKAAVKNPKLKLIIAGRPDGDALAKHYNDMIDAMQSKSQVLFDASFIPDEKVAEYFTASDMLTLPYTNIYHSGVLHLAYSFALPVLATRVGDFEESIEHGKSGVLLEENTEKALTAAIEKAFANPVALADMGKYARRLSEDKYSWSNVANITKSTYEALAA